MILPKLEEGMVVKCIKSSVSWWITGKNYTVNASGCITADDGDGNYSEGKDVSMEFEIIPNKDDNTIYEIYELGNKYLLGSCEEEVIYRGVNSNGRCIVELSNGGVFLLSKNGVLKPLPTLQEELYEDIYNISTTIKESDNNYHEHLVQELINRGWTKG